MIHTQIPMYPEMIIFLACAFIIETCRWKCIYFFTLFDHPLASPQGISTDSHETAHLKLRYIQLTHTMPIVKIYKDLRNFKSGNFIVVDSMPLYLYTCTYVALRYLQ